MKNFKCMFELIKEAEEKFPSGTKIVLISTNDTFTSLPSDLKCIFDLVDATNTVHTNWDKGRYWGVIFGKDQSPTFPKEVLTEEQNK